MKKHHSVSWDACWILELNLYIIMIHNHSNTYHIVPFYYLWAFQQLLTSILGMHPLKRVLCYTIFVMNLALLMSLHYPFHDICNAHEVSKRYTTLTLLFWLLPANAKPRDTSPSIAPKIWNKKMIQIVIQKHVHSTILIGNGQENIRSYTFSQNNFYIS